MFLKIVFRETSPMYIDPPFDIAEQFWNNESNNINLETASTYIAPPWPDYPL